MTHTPGPWEALSLDEDGGWEIMNVPEIAGNGWVICWRHVIRHRAAESKANARLIAAAPDMLAALMNVRKLISEAAMTGFNCKDGNWAQRLFESQQMTSAAIAKAEGKP